MDDISLLFFTINSVHTLSQIPNSSFGRVGRNFQLVRIDFYSSENTTYYILAEMLTIIVRDGFWLSSEQICHAFTYYSY